MGTEKNRTSRKAPPPAWVLHRSVPRLAALLPLAFSTLVCVSGQTDLKYKPWIEKDWTQWTERDCNIILNGSPWNQSSFYSFDMGSVTNSWRTDVQLRSALPIRQALLRQLQFQKRYDKMDATKKQSFDQAHMHDLDQTDQILVYILNSSFEPPPVNKRESTVIVGPVPPRQCALQRSDGTFVLPIQTNKVKYAAAQFSLFLNQYEYVFPRTVDGKPTFTSSDSSLVIVLGLPLVVDDKTKQVVQQPFQLATPGASFKISDLMYKGMLEY